MNVQAVKMEEEHLEQLIEQPGTRHFKQFVTPEQIKTLAAGKFAYAMITATGRVICCGGVVEYWPNRGEAWAIFDTRCRKEFIAIHNHVKRLIKICPWKRIEAAVNVEFDAGHRWAKALGFKMEAENMKAYRPDGGDSALYARIGG